MRRLDPGWRVVGAVAVLLACVSGFGFYSLAVYLHALTAGDVFPVATVSRATSLYLLTAGLAGLPVAALLSRLDARWVLAGGAALMAAGLAAVGHVRTPGQLYAAYLVLGLGQAGAGMVPGTTLVARWFVARRSAALAVASTGLSLGGIVVAPVIGLALKRHGLATLTPVAAVVFLAVCLLAVAAVRPYPPVDPAAPAAVPDGATAADAVRDRVFWRISAAQTLAVLAQVGGLTHLYALVAGRSSAAVAGAALSGVAIGSLTGRFLGSAVLTAAPLVRFGRALLLVQAGALLLLAVAGVPVLLVAGAVLFGLTIGNVLLVHPLLVAEAFGLRDFPRVLARSGVVATVGVATGPVVVGTLQEATGGYVAGYAVAAVASAAGALVLRGAPRSPAAPVAAVPAVSAA